MEAIFTFSNGTQCIGLFDGNTQTQEQILDAFETAKTKEDTFYLGAFPFDEITLKTADGYIIPMKYPWILSTDVVAWEIKEAPYEASNG